jgi:hypothetical protein
VSVGLLGETVSSTRPYAFWRLLATAVALYDCVGFNVPVQSFIVGKTLALWSLTGCGTELTGGALAQLVSAVEATAAVRN